MWELFRAGGPFMWPLLFCSIVAVAIVAERAWTLRDSRVIPADLLDKVWQIVESRQINDRVLAVLELNSPMGRLLAVGLRHHNRPRYVLRERMEDAGRHVVHELERFLNMLGTIAGIAPLLGLLGTVTGIIKSFNAISVGGMGDPRLLSTGISEALVCTAAGLCVAIPALIGYRLLRGRVDRLVVQMEKDATRFADALDLRSSSRKGA
jgi:biopolymer transport protein ExbB